MEETPVTSSVDLKEVLAQKEEELNRVKAGIQQIDNQAMKLQKDKDALLTKGIEIQGQVRLLQDLVK
jgi:hypothetical protein